MKTVAFYLPQFHEIPENNAWWGEGFTEWVNVRRARPSYSGHEQPRVAGDLGEYDLSDSDTHVRQSRLARDNGVDAFCMYFYWFNGQRLLEKPVESWREDGSLLPYCLSWANESWTRRWDGKSRDILMSQDYETGFAESLFNDLLPHFQAPHYLRQGGAPILVVHRAELIPDVVGMARTIRELARDAGLPGVHLVATETTPGVRPQALGFDAVVEFPPVGANTFATAQLRPLKDVDPTFRGRFMSYDKLAGKFASRLDPGFTRYRGVAPGWDNTARRQQAATVYVGASPSAYARWLQTARMAEQKARGEDGLVFINAWNEWAEGAYLEPDKHFGDSYLRATADPGAFRMSHEDSGTKFGRLWSYAQLHSLVLTIGGSVLSRIRRIRNALRK